MSPVGTLSVCAEQACSRWWQQQMQCPLGEKNCCITPCLVYVCETDAN